MKNNLYYLPWGNENVASSRLRVYNIGKEIEESYLGCPKEYQKGDVLIIQKTPDFEELQRAQSQGVKVIYDIDDYYWDKPEYSKMLKYADHITVDTEKKKEMLELIGSLRGKVTVIPDSLDWDGTKKEEYGKGYLIGWTGYGNNSAYLNDIKLNGTLRIIASPDWCHHYKGEAQSRPWSMDMVDTYLSQCDFGIYYLPKGEFEECKGMHKLLKNWAIGLPTYTSPMPDYVKAMEEAGVGRKYIVETKEDWGNLKMKYTKTDIEKCRKYALKYEAKNIVKLWQKVIKEVSKIA